MKIDPKRTIVSLALTVAMFAAGCSSDSGTPEPQPEPNPDPETEKTLKVAPGELSFTAEGGSLTLTVTAENVSWTAASEASWLTLSANAGTTNGEITVTALPNKASFELTATIVVTAEGVDPVTIPVKQAANTDPLPDDTKRLTRANIIYSGDYWGTGMLDAVLLEATDMEVNGDQVSGTGAVTAIDLNIPAATFATFAIDGDYTPSTALPPMTSYTFNTDEISRIVFYEADGSKSTRYTTGGSLSIRHSGDVYHIEMEFTFADHAPYKAIYDGTATLYDDSSSCLSTLTGNVQPVIESAEGTFYSYTNSPIAAYALELNLWGNTRQVPCENVCMMLNVKQSTIKDGAIEGTYTVIEKSPSQFTADDLKPGSAVPGYLTQSQSGDIEINGSWYFLFDTVNGEVDMVGFAPYAKGQAVISRNGETYTIQYTFVDDNTVSPHTISGTYTGPIAFSNIQSGQDPDPDDPDPDDPDPDDPDPLPVIDLPTKGQIGRWTPGNRW